MISSYLTITSEENFIEFSVGYDLEEKKYFMCSINFGPDKEEYWDNVHFIKNILKGLKTSIKEPQLKDFTETLESLNIKSEEDINKFKKDLLEVLEEADKLNLIVG